MVYIIIVSSNISTVTIVAIVMKVVIILAHLIGAVKVRNKVTLIPSVIVLVTVVNWCLSVWWFNQVISTSEGYFQI